MLLTHEILEKATDIAESYILPGEYLTMMWDEQNSVLGVHISGYELKTRRVAILFCEEVDEPAQITSMEGLQFGVAACNRGSNTWKAVEVCFQRTEVLRVVLWPLTDIVSVND